MENKKIDEEVNAFIYELKKFIKSEVEVSYYKGQDKVEIIRGILKAVNYSMLQVIIMTDTEKILIKNIIEIRRKRSF